MCKKFDEPQAKAVVEIIEEAFEEYKENQKEFLATKEDLYKLENKLENKLSDVRTEIIKWMFIFWIGQIGVLFAILFAFFKR